MAHEIDCRVLISEVQKRPALYDTKTKEYHDRHLKKKLWIEICREVYSASVWDSLSNKNKTTYGIEIQKRWSSLRHCFRRELNIRKEILSGSAVKKKRKYLYFDSLLFLLPHAEVIKTEVSVEMDEVSNEHGLENEVVNNSENVDANTIQAQPQLTQLQEVQKNNVEEIVSSIRDEIKILANTRMYENDEDELFLRSLIPYLKEFTGDQKLLLRMEIMKSILNFKKSLKEN